MTQQSMTPDEMRALYRGYVEVANTRDFDRLHEFVADVVTQNGVPSTRDAVAASLRAHTDAVPDLHWEVQDLVVEGNRIAARLRDTGTPRAVWHGLEPTGASVAFDEVAFYEVRDGRIAATWYLMDAAAVQRQLAG